MNYLFGLINHNQLKVLTLFVLRSVQLFCINTLLSSTLSISALINTCLFNVTFTLYRGCRKTLLVILTKCRTDL